MYSSLKPRTSLQSQTYRSYFGYKTRPALTRYYTQGYFGADVWSCLNKHCLHSLEHSWMIHICMRRAHSREPAKNWCLYFLHAQVFHFHQKSSICRGHRCLSARFLLPVFYCIRCPDCLHHKRNQMWKMRIR